jgi:adenosine kinase
MAEKNKILIVGSIAYDQLMHFDGKFKNIMLPNNYSIAITAGDRTVSFGGCGGNIAYSLRLLAQEVVLLTVVGQDFDQYKKRLIDLGIDTSTIYQSDKSYTAAAFIVTDREENQVTIFDAAAMNTATDSLSLKSFDYKPVAWAMIAPDNPVRMVRIANECKESGIPYVFDPAQQISHIKIPDLIACIQNAAVLIVNEYESELLINRIGISRERLNEMVPVFIETHGPKGSSVKSPEGMFYIKAVQPSALVDPTGCGDAFRAGLLYGLIKKLPIQKACQAGALMATYNIEHSGTQGHRFTFEEFASRFENSFGDTLC